MGQRDGHRAVADRAADPLGRPVADVAGGAACLERRVCSASGSRSSWGDSSSRDGRRGVREVRPGEDEAGRLRRRTPVSPGPSSCMASPPMQMNSATAGSRSLAAPASFTIDRHEPAVVVLRATAWHFGVLSRTSMCGMRRDPIVPGSSDIDLPRLSRRGRASSPGRRSMPRNIDRLAGRVAGPDKDDVVIAALGRLAAAGAVIDAAIRSGPRSPRLSRRRQTMP